MPYPNRNRIELIAIEARSYLETIWPEWHLLRGRAVPALLSQGTCQTSSLFLIQVFCHQNIAAHVAQGNDPSKDEGYYDGSMWHGHAWVETNGLIVDITADQFQLPRVHIVEFGSKQYKAGADTASLKAKQQRNALVAAAMLDWVARN